MSKKDLNFVQRVALRLVDTDEANVKLTIDSLRKGWTKDVATAKRNIEKIERELAEELEVKNERLLEAKENLLDAEENIDPKVKGIDARNAYRATYELQVAEAEYKVEKLEKEIENLKLVADKKIEEQKGYITKYEKRLLRTE